MGGLRIDHQERQEPSTGAVIAVEPRVIARMAYVAQFSSFSLKYKQTNLFLRKLKLQIYKIYN